MHPNSSKQLLLLPCWLYQTHRRAHRLTSFAMPSHTGEDAHVVHVSKRLCNHCPCNHSVCEQYASQGSLDLASFRALCKRQPALRTALCGTLAGPGERPTVPQLVMPDAARAPKLLLSSLWAWWLAAGRRGARSQEPGTRHADAQACQRRHAIAGSCFSTATCRARAFPR